MKCESCSIFKRELKKTKEENHGLTKIIDSIEKKHALLQEDFLNLKQLSEGQNIPISPGQTPREGKKFVTLSSGLAEVDANDKKYQ